MTTLELSPEGLVYPRSPDYTLKDSHIRSPDIHHPDRWMWSLITNLDQSYRARNARLIILKNVLLSIKSFNFSFLFGTLLGLLLESVLSK